MTINSLWIELILLISARSTGAAEELVASHPLQFGTSDYEGSLLHRAISAGSEVATEWLLHQGIDHRLRDGRGLTALMFACSRGSAALARLIISRDVTQVNERSSGWAPWTAGRTPIMFINEDRDLAQHLLTRGADVNAQADDGATPLMVAAESNSVPLLDLFLSNGANKEAVDESGKGALSYAVESEAMQATEFLLSVGIRISDYSRLNELPVLQSAILNENPELVDLLLRYGAKVSAVDGSIGENALELAKRVGAPETIIAKLRAALSSER
jgi:ankyrin repeat protein